MERRTRLNGTLGRIRLLAASMAMVLLLAVIQVPASVGAQDGFCETDPLVAVTADDGATFIVNLHYRASLQIAKGRMVTMAEMTAHLMAQNQFSVKSAKRDKDTYRVRVETVVQPWVDGTSFPVSAYLVFDPTGQVSPLASGKAGDTIRAEIVIPASSIPNAPALNKNKGKDDNQVVSVSGW